MSEQTKPHSEKQKLPTPKETGILFVQTIEENRRYLEEQHKKGFVNAYQLERFEKFAQESLEEHKTDTEGAMKQFNEGREKILRDTGIELSKEREISDMQLQLYKNQGINRYTYKNQIFGQFRKGLIDELIVGNYELVVMLKEHGSEVLANLFSMETIKHMVSSLGESFVDVLTGDAYMKGKSTIAAILSVMGATALLNLLTRGALKAGISNAISGVNRRVADAYTIHTPKIDALNLTSGRDFPKPKIPLVHSESITAVKQASVIAVASTWVASQAITTPEKIVSQSMDKPSLSPETWIHFNVEGSKLFIQDISGTSESQIRRELSRILDNSSIQTVQFPPHLDTAKKRILSNILAKNHPLIEVLRLIPWNDVVNVSFSGIKKLNDTYGQSFVDTLLLASKNRMIQSMDEYAKAWGKSTDHIRLVRDDYKNLTISLPPDREIESMLFHAISSKESFLKQIISDMDATIQSLVKENKMNPKTGKKIDLDMIRKDILDNWNFGVGKSRVEFGAENEQKLYAFAQAELVSRDGLADKNIVAKVFESDRSLKFAREAVQKEENIIKNYWGTNFVSEWVSYPVVMIIKDIDRKDIAVIHPELLRLVRKNGNDTKIDSKELSRDIKEYIDTLNAWFDFITPAHDLKRDLKIAQKMSDDFWKGIIERGYLLDNFKGVMSKEHFMHTIDKKPGMCMFVDIKDMGIQNLQSFQHLSRKVASGKSDMDDLLSAGKEVTDSFIVLVNKIKEVHPNARIALWWDEVYIFFPWASEKEANILLWSIHKKLQISQLEGRISHSVELQNNENIFKKLDESTILHKMVETKLARERTILYGSQKMPHETIGLTLWSGKTEREVLSLFDTPVVQKRLTEILQWIAKGEKMISEKIPLPSGKWQLLFRHDNDILQFIFT